ncbi:MAG TPA: YbaK/EbsC family protein [Candidatus Saccharimonadales bacterium]|nr:YbaK/EbsC family protein [Candidatus Saccharimonadales bacterium]
MPDLLPSVKAALQDAGIVYDTMDCDPALADTVAFCQYYGFRLGEAANAIIVVGKTDPLTFACCIVLATTKLDVNKAVCKQMGVKRASFAGFAQSAQITGMESGGVTPFGLPADMPMYVDAAVLQPARVVMGGGNRSSKVVLSPKELQKLPHAVVVEGLAKPKDQ